MVVFYKNSAIIIKILFILLRSPLLHFGVDYLDAFSLQRITYHHYRINIVLRVQNTVSFTMMCFVLKHIFLRFSHILHGKFGRDCMRKLEDFVLKISEVIDKMGLFLGCGGDRRSFRARTN